MKDIMTEELLSLYVQFCDAIDIDDKHSIEHRELKNNLGEFMYWLENGSISYFNLN